MIEVCKVSIYHMIFSCPIRPPSDRHLICPSHINSTCYACKLIEAAVLATASIAPAQGWKGSFALFINGLRGALQRLQTCMLGLACLGVHGPCRLKLLATEPPLQRRQFSGSVVPKRTLTCCTNLLHNQCEAAPRSLENIGFFGIGAVSCSRHHIFQ